LYTVSYRITTSQSMQGPPNPTEEDEASVPTEPVPDDPHSSGGAFMLRRRAAKRTVPWDLAAEELDLLSPPPQAVDIPARKKPRLEEPLPTTTDQAARKAASPDVSEGLPPPVVDDDNDANADPVTDTQPNAEATPATGSWTLQEDAKLISAVANTSKKKRGKEYTKDWAAIAELVPGRTKNQCRDRWKDVLDPDIDRANRITATWTEDENSKLKDAVQMHGGKNWAAIAALVTGRTRIQCRDRWKDAFDPNIDQVNGRKGKWSDDEDSKLKDAVQTHGGKNWAAITALVPGRTKKQCRNRWKDRLDPNIDQANGRKGNKWAEHEDTKLKEAVQTHGGKNWAAIAALVTGRTKMQCSARWRNALVVNIDPTAARTGKWSEDEDSKLKDAVQTHGGKNWGAITALVPGRTRDQCRCRWRDALDPDIDRATRITTTWTEDEDTKLKDAVHAHGGKNWAAIAALVLGRTKMQCMSRWHNALKSNIDRASGRTGIRAEEEERS
jgi:hypothetical protein